MKSIWIILFSLELLASARPFEQVRYKTYFGQCPSKSVGSLTLELVKLFEKTQSLKSLKEEMLEKNLMEKHFLSDYKVSYEPQHRLLKFNYDCPEPLLKVQVFREDGEQSYNAILVSNGNLFDPTYEVLLRHENKISYDLPVLSVPISKVDSLDAEITSRFMNSLPLNFREKIAEVILDGDDQLTLILSIANQPVSVFMGNNQWVDKGENLLKMLGYMEKTKRFPKVINLTNLKKVVVKFAQ